MTRGDRDANGTLRKPMPITISLGKIKWNKTSVIPLNVKLLPEICRRMCGQVR